MFESLKVYKVGKFKNGEFRSQNSVVRRRNIEERIQESGVRIQKKGKGFPF